jgi:signal transduction histidine kinase
LALDNAWLYRDAQRAIQVREVFFSLAAHELKTPLTALTGQAQLMQRRSMRDADLPERYERSLQSIVTQAARLNRLVLSLLDISRLEQGKLSLDLDIVMLNELVEQVIAESQELYEGHTIEQDVRAARLIINGDPIRLEQVILNLLQNAVKYSPPGSTIRLVLEQHEQHAQLSVSDHGAGIPPEALAHIFERFYRAANVTAGERGGLGIGLYIVKEIIDLHGGTIRVESVLGTGTTFTLRLPLYERNSPSEQ